MAEVRVKKGNGLTLWRPLSEMEELEQHLFDDIIGTRFFPAIQRRMPIEEMRFTPAIDVYEKNDRFVVKAELPGMKMDDIDVSVSADTLTISGEKKESSEVKEKDYYRSECSYGSFSRSITLPSSVNANKIEANYEDGILEVHLPKAAGKEPKKITIAKKENK